MTHPLAAVVLAVSLASVHPVVAASTHAPESEEDFEVIEFDPEPRDYWTTRTLFDNRYAVETVSAGETRITTYQTRRAQVSTEELERVGEEVEFSTVLRSYESRRNGLPGVDPVLEPLVGQKIGVLLGRNGRFLKDAGLANARARLERQLAASGGLASHVSRTLTTADLASSWESSAGRYLGRSLQPGHTLFFAERFVVPLTGRVLDYFSAQTVKGPATVMGRKACVLEVRYFSATGQLSDGGQPLTPEQWTQFKTWVSRMHPRPSQPDGRIDGGGTITLALNGTGTLEEAVSLHVRLLGEAAAGVQGTGPRLRSIDIQTVREKQVLGPPAPTHSGPPRLGRGRPAAKPHQGRRKPK